MPEEILTEIVFLDIIYTALNILCKSADTNQSSILNINSYTLSYTQILANELINTYTLAATSSLHQSLWDCIFFFCWNWSSLDQKKKREAAPRSQLLAVTKWTLLQAYVRKKIYQILTVCFFSPTYSKPVSYHISSATKQQLLQHIHRNARVKLQPPQLEMLVEKGKYVYFFKRYGIPLAAKRPEVSLSYRWCIRYKNIDGTDHERLISDFMEIDNAAVIQPQNTLLGN